MRPRPRARFLHAASYGTLKCYGAMIDPGSAACFVKQRHSTVFDRRLSTGFGDRGPAG
jgi:hypothetical protein